SEPNAHGTIDRSFMMHNDTSGRNDARVSDIWARAPGIANVGGVAALCVLLAGAASAQAPGQPSAVIDVDCDHACLVDFTERYLGAPGTRDTTRVPSSSQAPFTENNVEMPLGNDGLWCTINAVWEDSMTIADEQPGNVSWFGIVEEHGNPAYL